MVVREQLKVDHEDETETESSRSRLETRKTRASRRKYALEDETKESKFSLHNGAFNDTAVHVFKSGFVRPGF